MSDSAPILICRCAERQLLEGVDTEEGAAPDAVCIDDLCRVAVEHPERLQALVAQGLPRVYACHPRAVRALFAYAGAALPDTAKIINLRKPVVEKTVKPTLHGKNPAWYPVIDEARCSQCGQCFEFCLFGVYEKSAAGEVQVKNPLSCKNNCPACARICPEAAIIFPKVGESPMDGAIIEDETALKGKIQLNVDELLGNDVYAALNARKQKRRKLLNEKKVQQALAERKQCAGDAAEREDR